ncbi:hypothetical protein [Paenibacillus lactis]|nr:hypothetical protein [Paenibacillus lactis]
MYRHQGVILARRLGFRKQFLRDVGLFLLGQRLCVSLALLVHAPAGGAKV